MKEYIYIYIYIYRSFLLRMGNVSDTFEEKIKKIHCVQYCFFPESRAFYEMWKNTVERGRPQMTIWRMRIACWIPKATNTHTSCVTLIAIPLQQLLHERVSMLRHTYSIMPVLFFHSSNIK